MPYFMYVALQGDDKILTFKMDPDSGKLEPEGELAIWQWTRNEDTFMRGGGSPKSSPVLVSTKKPLD